jgi:hypothetical protein
MTYRVGQFKPTGCETGTDFHYKKRAARTCPECGGWGEYHVPYEDYDTFIIHRCECTDKTGEDQ